MTQIIVQIQGFFFQRIKEKENIFNLVLYHALYIYNSALKRFIFLFLPDLDTFHYHALYIYI